MIERLTNDLHILSSQIRSNTFVKDSLKQISQILVAAGLYKALLVDDVLEAVLSRVDNAERDERLIMARILLKYLETSKRFFIAGKFLEATVKLANDCASDSQIECILLGILMLQILFDIDEEISEKILDLGGLNSIINNCSSKDVKILETCSLAILKAVLNGGQKCGNLLLDNENQVKWLIPMLNIYDKKSIRFYAYMIVSQLRTIHGKNHRIFWSGFLNDINYWISYEETCSQLLKTVSLNFFNKNKEIDFILPMLTGSCKISHTLGAFLVFCKVEKSSPTAENVKIFSQNQHLIQALKRNVFISNDVAKRFATKVLRILGEEVPAAAPLSFAWKPHNIQEWIKIIELSDFEEFFMKFEIAKILSMRDEELKENFFMFGENSRKTFLSEVEILKRMTLRECEKDEYKGIKGCKASVDRNLSSKSTSSENNFDHRNGNSDELKKEYDIFISYRRSNGSDLASLFKFILNLKGFKVFFDVDSLQAGHFGNNLIKNVQRAKNFILILTPNALDRCVDDHDNMDWVRKEISTALVSNCNIIPVAKDFNNEIFYHKGLPDDIRKLIDLNQVIWHHDSQVSLVVYILNEVWF